MKKKEKRERPSGHYYGYNISWDRSATVFISSSLSFYSVSFWFAFCTHAYLMPRLNEQMWLRSQMKCFYFIFFLYAAYDCLTTTKMMMMMMMILMYIEIEWENDWKFIEWFHVFLIPLTLFSALLVIITIFDDDKA